MSNKSDEIKREIKQKEHKFEELGLEVRSLKSEIDNLERELRRAEEDEKREARRKEESEEGEGERHHHY